MKDIVILGSGGFASEVEWLIERINQNEKIGNHVIINLDSTIGHSAILEDYCTVYPSVNISGNVIIRKNIEIGTGVNIIQGVQIGENTIIGAGSVVVKDLPKNCTAVGAPAKLIKQNKEYK